MKKLALSILSLTIFSCSSSDDTPVTPTPEDTRVAFFNSNIDNTSVVFERDNTLSPTSFNSFNTGFTGMEPNKYFYYGSKMERANSSDLTNLELTMHNMYYSVYYSGETANFYSAFDSKPTIFLTEDQELNYEKGISVFYTDATGETYSSLYGSQVGSTITYNSNTQGVNTSGLKTVTVTGTMNCKLYNTNDITDIKTLTNGSFKLAFVEFD